MMFLIQLCNGFQDTIQATQASAVDYAELMRACWHTQSITLTVKSCTRMFWRGVEKGSVRVRTPPLVLTTDCSFRL